MFELGDLVKDLESFIPQKEIIKNNK